MWPRSEIGNSASPKLRDSKEGSSRRCFRGRTCIFFFASPLDFYLGLFPFARLQMKISADLSTSKIYEMIKHLRKKKYRSRQALDKVTAAPRQIVLNTVLNRKRETAWNPKRGSHPSEPKSTGVWETTEMPTRLKRHNGHYVTRFLLKARGAGTLNSGSPTKYYSRGGGGADQKFFFY